MQTTALHENLLPPHSFEWDQCVGLGWGVGGADTEGKKNGSAWLNLCERAKSSGKVLHWSSKILHTHFPDYCITYFSCLSVNTKKEPVKSSFII